MYFFFLIETGISHTEMASLWPFLKIVWQTESSNNVSLIESLSASPGIVFCVFLSTGVKKSPLLGTDCYL